MKDLIILDIFWDRRLVQDKTGKEFEIFRGKDYELDWVNLGHGYAKNNSGVYLRDTPCFKPYHKQIDLTSFEMIQANKSENTFYFKDKHNVFIDSYMCPQAILKNADPSHFKIINIDKGYSTSNTNNYWYDSELPYKIAEIHPLNDSYQKVGNEIYFGHLNKLECDHETFQIIHEKVPTVARDKNHVFYKADIIEGADPETFHFLETCIGKNAPYYLENDIHFYAKDKQYAYFINVPFGYKIIKTKDLDNFDFVVHNNIGYGKDAHYLYEKGKRKKLTK
ncbi:MAG: DKNYY domain-containing protein [Putridiphycobacter sp.]